MIQEAGWGACVRQKEGVDSGCTLASRPSPVLALYPFALGMPAAALCSPPTTIPTSTGQEADVQTQAACPKPHSC